MKTMRKQSGNLLAVTSLSAAGFVAMTLVALSYVSILFLNNRLQTDADSLALFGANNLNSHDRIGQMNTMIARSRQLVFSSRESLKDAQIRHPQLANFANQMLEESQLDAQELEQERSKLKHLVQQEAREAIEAEFNTRFGSAHLNLPWIKAEHPSLVISFGEQTDLSSNAIDASAIPDLSSFDAANNRLTENAHYVKGHLNATLPEADSYLNFNFTKLPPCVNGKASVSHVISAEHYKAFDNQDAQISTACKISLCVEVSGNKTLGTAETQLKLESAATTAGELSYLDD